VCDCCFSSVGREIDMHDDVKHEHDANFEHFDSDEHQHVDDADDKHEHVYDVDDKHEHVYDADDEHEHGN